MQLLRLFCLRLYLTYLNEPRLLVLPCRTRVIELNQMKMRL
ncbi:hypothetical protein Goklo_014656 [Gossypium klotzschianum]|uniref:Uncharacterized protein n=1 Tax=Gossypium klotzschianum TaxID=34286 RepID=A0A7J8U8E9_9ROSI|nr:hypothetical protein [Gossypium klotzschianum]